MKASYRLALWWLGLNSLDKLAVAASIVMGLFVVVMFALILGVI